MVRTWLLRIVVALGAVGVLGFLFMRSVRGTRAQPYTVDARDLRGWSLEIVTDRAGATAPLLVLRPPGGLVHGLYDQLFKRAMDSLSTPEPAAIPIVLRGEAGSALVGAGAPDALLAAARNAGIDERAFRPRCLGYRRVSEPTRTRQLYFLLFDAPGLAGFRSQIGLREALSPVLLIGTSQSDGEQWLPLRADPARDCVAPIVTSR